MAISNPKTMLFYLALLPNLVPLADISLATFAELVALLTLVYSAVLAAYMISAVLRPPPDHLAAHGALRQSRQRCGDGRHGRDRRKPLVV